MDLPSETEFRLLALVFAERSGREVAREYALATGRDISYGTLYTTFRRLKEKGWVTVRDSEDEDGRVRWFKITSPGSRAMSLARDHHRELAAFGLHGRLA